MAGIFISGMEMPEKGALCLKIYPSGTVTVVTDFDWTTLISNNAKAVPVPPHGDLIDRDALPWEKQGLLIADEDWALSCSLIEDAPTIIPADHIGDATKMAEEGGDQNED